MDETNTHITWPSKLKIGAKSKKGKVKKKYLVILYLEHSHMSVRMSVRLSETEFLPRMHSTTVETMLKLDKTAISAYFFHIEYCL